MQQELQYVNVGVTEADLTHHSKVPGLADVPIVGRLFDTENGSRTKTDLYIVVTPHVVRGRVEADHQGGR